MTVLRPIQHEARLSVIDHLDELRKRIFVSGGTLFVAFGLCFAYNQPLIRALNRALPASAKTGLGDQAHQDATLHSVFNGLGQALHGLADKLQAAHSVVPGAARYAAQAAHLAHVGASVLPATASSQERPIVFGVGEGFTTTLMVAAYFALMITLPVLLYQLYAFVIPALSKTERRVAVPSMIAAPFLFVAGCVFSYFAVLPPAVHFLQGYNSSVFQVVVQASSYYKFEIMLIMG
ncbi:MAG: twin-arginine translocase subunit TatC, partial [Solirubrobacteraceae bacterium]